MSRKYLTGIDLSKNELLNAAIQNLATAPSSPAIGQIYFDTELNHLRQWDGSQWLDYLTAESGAGYITSVGSNLDVTDQQLTLGANVVITDASQTLTNKTYSTATLKGAVSFTNSADTEILSISQTGTGTVRLSATDDLSLRSTNGDILLYPGNEAGGVGKVYIGWGNANANTAYGVAGADREVATVGTSQVFSNKTFSDGIDFNNGTDGTSSIYINGNDLTVVANNDLYLNTNNGKIDMQPDTGGANVWGDRIITANASQTLVNKTLGSEADGGTTLGTDLNANGYIITGLGTPLNPGDSATKGYVDGLVQGLDVKESALYRSDANIDLVTWNADGSFIDGNDIWVVGNRVLLTEQDDPTENGIYVVQNDGSLARAADADAVSTELNKGSYVLVTSGTYAATGWIVVYYSAGATGWTQFSAANEYNAGDGISIGENNTIAVSLDSDSLSVSGSGLKVNYHTDGGLDNDSGMYVKIGTGLTFDGSGNIVIDSSNGYGVRKYAATNTTITPTSNVATWEVIHGLGTRDVTVQVYTLDTYEQIEVDVARTGTSTVTLNWVATAEVAADSYRVVIVG